MSLKSTRLELSADEAAFLRMVYDPDMRGRLLIRLERLGLLRGFLEAEGVAV